ncbi:hypothetical protein AC579_562 [Pseudocercospora musae]|uniref:Methyltransferase domain-containing protein n=1 Tax=Pseudocercospora musae TaxID=113226 RepID=A0A139IRB5_9PEZI|nr:hypothetical protein AC579_562 [Pseudocercospora musae]
MAFLNSWRRVSCLATDGDKHHSPLDTWQAECSWTACHLPRSCERNGCRTWPLNGVVDVSQPRRRYNETDEKLKVDTPGEAIGKEQYTTAGSPALSVEAHLNGFSERVPVTSEMKNVLDVGTGTGIWAIEIAHAFPHLQVFGVDLSAIQPESRPSK